MKFLSLCLALVIAFSLGLFSACNKQPKVDKTTVKAERLDEGKKAKSKKKKTKKDGSKKEKKPKDITTPPAPATPAPPLP